MRHVDVHAHVHPSPAGVAVDAGDGDVVPVEALPSADDQRLGSFSDRNEVLPSYPDGVVDCIRPRTGKPGPAIVLHAPGGVFGHNSSQPEHRLVGEHMRRSEGDFLSLGVHGIRDALDAMADVHDNRRAGRPVKVALTVTVEDVDSFGPFGHRHLAPRAVDCRLLIQIDLVGHQDAPLIQAVRRLRARHPK